jgi:hypothetical protein
MTGHKNTCKPISAMGGLSSVLKTERNNISIANFSDSQQGSIKKIFATEIEDQGSQYPVLRSCKTEFCFLLRLHCSA